MNNNTENHHFSVVIPKRERCDILEHALHTCVIQDYENLEIIVSDNFSQDRTREVVESYKDPRIRYINTGKRLSMTDNFEFALSNVRPERYVIYIGDDDGLLPNAIRDINAVIVETETQVLWWELAHYWWPTLESNCANRLYMRIPMISATTNQNVLSFKAPYQFLPVMYMYSAIEYEVIRRIKDSCVVFDTIIEDMPDDMFPDRPWGKGNNPKTAAREYLRRLKKEGRSAADGAPLHFEIDKMIENKLLITVAPDGYLKRMR